MLTCAEALAKSVLRDPAVVGSGI